MHWDPGFTHFVSLSNFRSDREASIQNVSSFTIPFYAIDRRTDYFQASQEIRASDNITRNLDYVSGLYFFHSNYRLIQHTGGALFGGGPYYQSQDTNGLSTSAAGFADFDWSFAPKWRANVGGRFTYDEKSLDTFAPLIPYEPLTDFGKHTDHWTKFTPKVSFDFRPTEDHMLYASWSLGYRSGGFNGRGLTQVSAVTPFNPETVNAYEIGVKTAWFERRLLANLALFYTDYKDIQETITESGGSTGNITIEKNAASAKIKGVELDFTAKPLDNLTARGSFGYLNSHFSGFQNAEAFTCAVITATCAVPSGLHNYDYSDVDLIYAPNYTGSLAFDYEIPVPYGNYKATLGYRYIGPYDQQIARDDSLPVVTNTGTTVLTSNDPRVRSNPQNLLDASLALAVPSDHGEVLLTVFGRNLTDNRGPASAFTVAGLWAFATAREPRVFGVRLGYKF
jgi:iron complex outermembrane recepter protein